MPEPTPPHLLPVLPQAGSPGPVRRDAVRNREALLEAAAQLIAEGGVAAVTMDDVARRAGVGKGTVFRRFGSREGLMATLLDHDERAWQDAVISGPPPLGPGAGARERLAAFADSRLEHNLRQVALIEAAGRTWGDNRAVTGFITLHVRHLLAELGARGDLTYLASTLVAALNVPTLRQQLGAARLTRAQVLAGWDDLVRRIVEAPPR